MLAIAAVNSQVPTPLIPVLTKARPVVAFHANVGIGSTIRTATDFTVEFPGGDVTFKAGEGVGLFDAELWLPGSDIVIAMEPRGFSGQHMLMASLRRDAQGPILGGFRLDETGAVLAGSFWDIAEEGPTEPGIHPVAARIRDFILDRHADGLDTYRPDLLTEFSDAEITAHFPTAKGAANRQSSRPVETDTQGESQARLLQRATAALLARMPTETEIRHILRTNEKLFPAQIDALWPDLLPCLAEAFKTARMGIKTERVQ